MKDSCSEKRRILFHVDMDYFFSAIEERENPDYASKPSLERSIIPRIRVTYVLTGRRGIWRTAVGL